MVHSFPTDGVWSNNTLEDTRGGGGAEGGVAKRHWDLLHDSALHAALHYTVVRTSRLDCITIYHVQSWQFNAWHLAATCTGPEAYVMYITNDTPGLEKHNMQSAFIQIQNFILNHHPWSTYIYIYIYTVYGSWAGWDNRGDCHVLYLVAVSLPTILSRLTWPILLFPCRYSGLNGSSRQKCARS